MTTKHEPRTHDPGGPETHSHSAVKPHVTSGSGLKWGTAS
jgi:hypothetical protein